MFIPSRRKLIGRYPHPMQALLVMDIQKSSGASRYCWQPQRIDSGCTGVSVASAERGMLPLPPGEKPRTA